MAKNETTQKPQSPVPPVGTTPVTPGPTEEVKSKPVETISMTKEQYDALMDKMGKMQDQINYVADKSRTERWEAQQNTGKSLLPVAGVSFLDGKPIVGWMTVANEAEMRGNIYHERQITELTFLDGSKQKMDLVEFYRHKSKVSGEVISKKKETSGNIEAEVWTIKLPDGQEITLDKTFIN